MQEQIQEGIIEEVPPAPPPLPLELLAKCYTMYHIIQLYVKKPSR